MGPAPHAPFTTASPRVCSSPGPLTVRTGQVVLPSANNGTAAELTDVGRVCTCPRSDAVSEYSNGAAAARPRTARVTVSGKPVQVMGAQVATALVMSRPSTTSIDVAF